MNLSSSRRLIVFVLRVRYLFIDQENTETDCTHDDHREANSEGPLSSAPEPSNDPRNNQDNDGCLHAGPPLASAAPKRLLRSVLCLSQSLAFRGTHEEHSTSASTRLHSFQTLKPQLAHPPMSGIEYRKPSAAESRTFSAGVSGTTGILGRNTGIRWRLRLPVTRTSSLPATPSIFRRTTWRNSIFFVIPLMSS